MLNLIILATLLFIFITSIIYLKRKNYTIKEGTGVGNNIVMKLKNKFNILSSEDYWNPEGKDWKNKTSQEYSKAWKDFKPEIKKIFSENNIKQNKNFSNKAVIHFRCSDTPFMKHPNYNLMTRDYFYFALEKIEKEGVDEIVFSNCSSWNAKFISDPEEKCNNYIEIIADWLEGKTDIKINRKKYCVSVKETYEMMLGAKILVGTGGSFSFIPGMIKDKNFISPSNIGEGGLELFKRYKNLHEEVHWSMWNKFDRISHKNLDYETFDYKNYEVNSSFKVNLN